MNDVIMDCVGRDVEGTLRCVLTAISYLRSFHVHDGTIGRSVVFFEIINERNFKALVFTL